MRGWSQYIAEYHRTHPGITEAALEHARHPVHGTAYQWLAAAVPGPHGDVLDLACGSAPMHDRLEHRSYLGIDASAAELQAARAAGRGRVTLGDVTRVPVPDTSIDTAVMSMALMLVPLRATLEQVARVLRPGGTFAAMVPAVGPLVPGDLRPLVALSLPLHGPGRMPALLRAGPLARALLEAGLQPRSKAAVRFPFGVTTADHAELAVRSLYTPGSTAVQRARAARRLVSLRRPLELPVPILRFTATKQ